MSTKDQPEESSINITSKDDLPNYVSDPEYISKIINQFIMGDDDKTIIPKKTVAGNQHYNRRHVIKALTNLQLTFRPRYVPGQAININTDEFKSALLNSMAKLDDVAIPKSMNQIDSRTIDFVEMIFSAFLRDKNVSDIVKDLLLMMQIPIIKTALLDKSFFNNEKHTARHVLNSIAHIAIGVEDRGNKVYKTIQYIIEQLLQSFDEKLDVFDTARLSLDRLAGIVKREHEKTEKQIQQELTREYARHLVLKELQYYTLNTDIPPSIQPLILTHWASLMYQRFTNYGKDSIEWREAIGILRLMIKSLQPIKSREDWQALRSIYKGIVNSVRSCLDNSRQNKEKVFIATSNLNNYYHKKISGSEFFTDVEREPEPESTVVNLFASLKDDPLTEIEPSPMDKQEAVSKEIIERMPDYIQPNSWFEVFTDYKHPVRRLKLSVVLQEQAKLVFVDFMGNKVIEKTIRKFLTELKNDQSRPISDHSIFEYALSMVIISIAARE